MIVNRWALVEPFNPSSTYHVRDYIKAKGYKMPLDRKTRKPTTGKEGLITLIKKHHDAVLEQSLEARHLRKAEGYLDDAMLGRDSRFHPTFTTKPDTGRLASINPNFQNVPNHGVDAELAKAIRSTIIPTVGHVLVELDWRNIEAVLTGWFAGDEGYMRLSLQDSHTYYMWAILFDKGIVKDIPPDMLNPELGVVLKTFRKEWEKYELAPGQEARHTAKTANLATSYGMGAKHLSELLRIPITEAMALLAVKDRMAPKVAVWKEDVMDRAHYQGFLENPFLYRRAFFNVKQRNQYGEWRPGEEANEALAFLPQSTAAGMFRETILRVAALPGYGKVFHILVPIHDALLLEAPEGDAAVETAARIRELMERPWAELGGLTIPVEVKTGTNWGEMN